MDAGGESEAYGFQRYSAGTRESQFKMPVFEDSRFLDEAESVDGDERLGIGGAEWPEPVDLPDRFVCDLLGRGGGVDYQSPSHGLPTEDPAGVSLKRFPEGRN